jgi:hypothetical protein
VTLSTTGGHAQQTPALQGVGLSDKRGREDDVYGSDRATAGQRIPSGASRPRRAICTANEIRVVDYAGAGAGGGGGGVAKVVHVRGDVESQCAVEAESSEE